MKKENIVNYGPALSVGVSKETVAELRGAINDILISGAEQKTLRLALNVLSSACQVNNTTISDCHFEQGLK